MNVNNTHIIKCMKNNKWLVSYGNFIYIINDNNLIIKTNIAKHYRRLASISIVRSPIQKWVGYLICLLIPKHIKQFRMLNVKPNKCI